MRGEEGLETDDGRETSGYVGGVEEKFSAGG